MSRRRRPASASTSAQRPRTGPAAGLGDGGVRGRGLPSVRDIQELAWDSGPIGSDGHPDGSSFASSLSDLASTQAPPSHAAEERGKDVVQVLLAELKQTQSMVQEMEQQTHAHAQELRDTRARSQQLQEQLEQARLPRAHAEAHREQFLI
jgi:hypothetical protein